MRIDHVDVGARLDRALWTGTLATLVVAGLSYLISGFGFARVSAAWIVVRSLSKVGVALALAAGLLHLLLRWRVGRARAGLAVATTLLALTSCVTALLLGEAAARFGLRDVTTVFDGRYYPSVRWEREHPVPHNAWGFRERELPASLQEGAYKIAVVGDGFLHTQGIPEELVLTRILERQLNDLRDPTGRRFQVLNFGRGGAQTADEIDILRDHVLDLEPDYVVLQWFVNDADGPDEWQPPTFMLPGERLAEAHLGVQFRRWLRRHSAFYYLLAHKVGAIGMALGVFESFETHMERELADPRGTAALQRAAELREFVDLARSNGIPVGIIEFPLIAEVDGDPGTYPLGFLLDRVKTFCVKEAIPCVDLRDSFAGDHRASDLWVNRLDGHPGAGANRLAAMALVDELGEIWREAAAGDTGAPE